MALKIESDTELDKRLQFLSLLNDISTFFINLPADRVSSEIETAQRRICEFLNLDRSALFQISRENSDMLLTHVFQPSDMKGPPERMNGRDFFPWGVEKILNGEIVKISKMTDLPAQAGRDREGFALYGTRSVVIIPLSVESGNIFGLLSFAVTREERNWSETMVHQFKAVAQIFANALARKKADLALHKSESRLNMVTDAAGAGLWVMEIDTGKVWVSPKTRELFHFSPGEDLEDESFFTRMHPDDHELVDQAVQQAISSGGNLRCEYRIKLPDGSTRWILALGKPYLDPAGKPQQLMGVAFDITERKQAEQELARRLQFESFLGEMSARFVNLAADRLDSEIKDVLCRICDLLGLDLAALWQWADEAHESFRPTHVYSSLSDLQPSEMTQNDLPWYLQEMLSGRIVAISSLEELPAEAAQDREFCRQLGIKSNLCLPLSVGGDSPIAILGLNTLMKEREWPEELVNQLKLIAQIFTSALERKRMDGHLQEKLREIEKLKHRVEQENIYLKHEVKLLLDHKEILGESPAIKRILSLSEQVALTESTVMIQGETGTGKGLLAQTIHNMSPFKDRPLVTVNCASLPSTLIESELFGREKGAYTGALTRMPGRFEVANGSTIFLDEIGELPHDVQSKLLQVLEKGRYERLGSTESRYVKVRIIAATNRDLAQEVQEGKFRKDLYYRLNVFPILIPPLRERTEDIPTMVWAFVKEFQKKMGKDIESIPKKIMEELQFYDWPGNVRELRNVIEHAMILNKGKHLLISIPGSASFEPQPDLRLEDVERRHIINIIKKTGWRLAGAGGAAEVLGLKRTTLYSKMKKLKIDRPASR